MKRILYLLFALILVFSLVSCDEEETPSQDAVGEVNGALKNEETLNKEEKEEKPEVFYTGVVCQLPSSGSYPFTAIKTDGTYDKLGETGVYGYPEVTSDGKFVFFRQSIERIERLFVMSPNSKPQELAQNASSFTLEEDGKWVAVRCKDGFYFTTDFSKPCEKIADISSIASFYVSSDGKKAAILDYDENLYLADIPSKSYTAVDSGVKSVIKKVCDNLFYYAKSDGLYEYRNGTSTFISSWWASTDFPEIFATGTERERTYHYINSDGTTFDIPEDASISSYTKMSPNNKYIVSGSGATLYRFEVTPTGLTNKP